MQKNKIRTAILASGNGTNFEAIVTAVNEGEIDLNIAKLVYNKKEAGVRLRAERFQIPTFFVDHRKFKNRLQFDEEILQELKDCHIDLVILAGWMRILSATFLDAFPHTLNIHPSLLPDFPGLGSIEKAFKARVKATGCTVHIVTPEMDEGPIIGQERVNTEGLNLEELEEKIHEAEHFLYPKAIKYYLENYFV